MNENRRTIILGIETSCDETSAAVVENGTTVLSNVISSQMDIHRKFGGVVPEVASRRHVERITLIIEKALHDAKVSMEEVDGIAVTQGRVGRGAVDRGGCSQSVIVCHRKTVDPGAPYCRAHLCQSPGATALLPVGRAGGLRRTYGIDLHGRTQSVSAFGKNKG